MEQKYMEMALSLAQQAERFGGDVPVGAVIVKDKTIIGSGFNRRELESCSIKHAEIIALEQACNELQTWRLLNCDMYVTLEPCLMCAGALYQSRIRKVFFAASDPKAGALGSLYCVHNDSRLNHNFSVEGGILAEQSSEMLKSFFIGKRNKKKQQVGKVPAAI